MPERKVWTPEEDRVLKLLFEERGIKKWADLPKIMKEEFKIEGRSAKQCRQRYHNHLAANINNAEISKEEEELIFQLQKDLGNKWAQISTKLPGRTDSQIKNHFYSKLRKALRKVNRKINKFMRRQYKQIKTSTLYHILQIFESRSKRSSHFEGQSLQSCKNIRDRLRQFQDIEYEDEEEELQIARQIAQYFAYFDKDIRRSSKKNTLKVSGNLYSSETLDKNLVSSTRSVYDEDSESVSNSDLYSSSGYDCLSFQSNSSYYSNRSMKPLKGINIIRSGSIDMEDEDQKKEDQRRLLFQSANTLHPRLTKSTQQLRIMENNIFQNQVSEKASSSKKSNKSQTQNQSYMFEQMTLRISGPRGRLEDVFTPNDLTNQEKMELLNTENDEMFLGEMNLEEDDLVKKIEGISLMENMPQLGRQHFDL